MAPFDQDAARAFALKVWQYKQGEIVAATVHLGDRLGLYPALYEAGPTTAEALAAKVGLDERWVREWLLGQAAAGLIERSREGEHWMTPEQAAVLVDEDSLLFATAAFAGGLAPEEFVRIEQSFKDGIGFTYGDMGIEQARQIDRTNAAWLRDFLPDVVIPLLDGVSAQLREGARVLDIGCGGGVALEGLADRYPAGEYVGIDQSGPAVAVATERFAGRGNVHVREEVGENLDGSDKFDLIMTLDCMHDMGRPDLTAKAIKEALADGGTWLVKDMRCGPTFESNARNPVLALMYGYSVTSCLASGTSTRDGLGLGTLGLDPATLQRLATDAGFTGFEQLETPDPVHYYYRITA